jgi:predicted MPP superfamily phosphohydrolase
MLIPQLLLFCLAVAGHFALCVLAHNQVHSTTLPAWAMRWLNYPLYLANLAAIPAMIAWRLSWGDLPTEAALTTGMFLPLAYLAIGWVVAVPIYPFWIWRNKFSGYARVTLANHTTVRRIDREATGSLTGDWQTALLARVPGNQIFKLHIHEKQVRIPRLPKALEGLSIAHLSDLHMLGNLRREFFESLVEHANSLQADMIAVTGDIVEKDRCVDWLAGTLGQLAAPQGVYFVLGNHDKRVSDAGRTRDTLTACGMIDLGGTWRQVEIRGEPVLLAGNELPWFLPGPDMSTAPPRGEDGRPPRILLSHSPDQIEWAKAHDFDLMLAGHTHGGQIRLPLIGPVVSPSVFGVKYASGTFFESPTLMHVSRGCSGEQAIRLNCPPELAKVVLRGDG